MSPGQTRLAQSDGANHASGGSVGRLHPCFLLLNFVFQGVTKLTVGKPVKLSSFGDVNCRTFAGFATGTSSVSRPGAKRPCITNKYKRITKGMELVQTSSVQTSMHWTNPSNACDHIEICAPAWQIKTLAPTSKHPPSVHLPASEKRKFGSLLSFVQFELHASMPDLPDNFE